MLEDPYGAVAGAEVVLRRDPRPQPLAPGAAALARDGARRGLLGVEKSFGERDRQRLVLRLPREVGPRRATACRTSYGDAGEPSAVVQRS